METSKGLPEPKAGSYKPFYKGYVARVLGMDLRKISVEQENFISTVFKDLSPAAASARYQPGKWSFNQLLGHMLDTEKIMHFRALCISRGEKASFPGFDQDLYVHSADFDYQSPQKLLAAFLLHRELLWEFIEQISPEKWHLEGRVDNHPMSVSALVYIIFGHMEHHIALLRSHYLPLLAPEAPL
ncbi:DinB family protein [Cyclobacterium roseum]|uniref:DinB family protein n=1 Tax=Cyclobacterium roseum TaxID=2666137 RepID=UPI0013919087|nr:DinB family protein [Cyclobacterium roseum]